MPSDDDRELGQMIKELAEGTKEELKTMLPNIDLSPEISDDKIKSAILNMNSEGWQRLYQQFGVKQVLAFVNEFSSKRRW